jgi:predicted TIM-barrel fold metal-dependent hydrolase
VPRADGAYIERAAIGHFHEGIAMAIERTSTRRAWLRRAALVGAAAAGSRVWGETAMAKESRGMRVVDPHVHVWKNDPRYPWRADLASPPKEDALPETLLGLMAEHGVEKTVIVHVIYYRWDCRYAADAVKAHRDKFMGVCRIDPQSREPASDLDHWVAEGFHGVRLSPGVGPSGEWINDVKQMDAIWNRTAELKIPMCVLCPIARIGDVEKVIARHDGRLDVCIDHMADSPIDQPEELNKLLRLARYERVYVKLSHLWSLSKEGYPYRDTHEQVRRLYDAFGPRRLMWGTDWPAVEEYCGYGRALALYRDEIKFFNDDDRKWILGETALRLWPFGKTS